MPTAAIPSFFGIDPSDLVGSAFRLDVHIVAYIQIDEVASTGLCQAVTVVHQVLAWTHFIVGDGIEEIPDRSNDIVARGMSFCQIQTSRKTTG